MNKVYVVYDNEGDRQFILTDKASAERLCEVIDRYYENEGTAEYVWVIPYDTINDIVNELYSD